MIEIKKYQQTIILEDLDNKSGYVLYCNGLGEDNFLQYCKELTDIIEEKLGFSDKLKEYFSNQIEARNFRLVREFVRYDNDLGLTQAIVETKDGTIYRTQPYVVNEIKEILKDYHESYYIVFISQDGNTIYLPCENFAKALIFQNL
jgi:hypothetical protein